jgi:DNA-binding CsgD family transcriptional regulator
MKQTKELAYLRKLCCLGLPKEIAAAEFLRAVQPLIPSENNVFVFVNDSGFPTYPVMEVFLPELLEPAAEHMPRFFDKRYVIKLGLNTGAIVSDTAAYGNDFYQSDMYNQVWRPANQHFMMMTDIYRHKRFMGRLMLFRPPAGKPFNNLDQNYCRQIQPYLAHALQDAPQNELSYHNNGEHGLAIADNSGRILYLCHRAKHLLLLATLSLSHPEQGSNSIQLPATISAICKNLDKIFKNKPAPAPAFTINNVHGRFIFNAHWLENNGMTEPGGLIGVTIQHQEPQALKILRALKDLPLSPAQKEVALLLAQGLSNLEIGQRLHIKHTTVKDHIGKIFTRLNINRREELLPLLLAKSETNLQYH